MQTLPQPWIKLPGTVPQQRAWIESPKRFHVVPAGRRSQKTWIAKRKLVARALAGTPYPNPRYFAAAPTRQQAKDIYWQHLKQMVPKPLVVGRPSETELVIQLVNGASIHVVGMERPDRIEGSPWDGGVLDEYANMKELVFTAHVRPMLADRQGWCDLIGVPEGYNHYYDLWQRAEDGQDPEWGGFTWWSEAVLPPAEIEAAKRDLPDQIYRQEYQAEFVNFAGRAYYAFDRDLHLEAGLAQLYTPAQDLILCLDFNVSPGVAVIAQELVGPQGGYTAVLGEVWIEKGSNTQQVLHAFLAEWGTHPGGLHVYGDQTGGHSDTARLLGSDWDIVNGLLDPVFGHRLYVHRPGFNPGERARVNAVNARLHTLAGQVRLKIDPAAAAHTVEDLEGTALKDDGSGKIDKKDLKRSHLTDALGYYIFAEHPMVEHNQQVEIEGF